MEKLFLDVYCNAIKSGMDNLTLLNLREAHKEQIDRGFKWVGYENWLNNLNKIYKGE
ncbi:MAG: hypothetical protein GY804_03680 [Alphaproteobacteria bacterium]|nr:hypothetical protein [Alphaproteobacteria bacterium]